MPEETYSILHDIRLFDQNHHFQIDTIIISAYFLLLLEIKNIAGTLLFDSKFNQLIRISEGNSEGFPDPILQVKRQEEQFRKWLSLNGFSRFRLNHSLLLVIHELLLKLQTIIS